MMGLEVTMDDVGMAAILGTAAVYMLDRQERRAEHAQRSEYREEPPQIHVRHCESLC
jgi:hypothetical protein